jgi:hypothetical protein
MQQFKDRLLAEVPTSGEIPYDALRSSLMQKGDRAALQQLHAMRRAGEIKVRVEKQSDGSLKTFVSRS